jgi:hypothetical protein
MKHRHRKPPSARDAERHTRWAALQARREASKQLRLAIGRVKGKALVARIADKDPGS